MEVRMTQLLYQGIKIVSHSFWFLTVVGFLTYILVGMFSSEEL